MVTQEPDTRARCPGPSAQDYLAADTRPVPDVLRVNVNEYLGNDDIDVERYISPAWHRMEVEKLWRRVWQFACREENIPEVGDHEIYEIADDSLLIVRTTPTEIRAFVNACLHRGRKLRTAGGHVPEFRCPFHGFTWNINGTLKSIPCAWDFPHVDPATFNLPEAKVATWGGFVFINMDPDCEPFETFAGDLPDHFTRWPLDDRYTSLHIAKILPCNWKIGQEAFMEAFHVISTHPQLLAWMGDANSQYDVVAGANWDRTVTPQGVPSPHLAGGVTEEEVLESFYFSRGFYASTQGRDLALSGDKLPEIPAGSTARAVLADQMRNQLSALSGESYAEITDSELLDAINYILFPNFHPWAGKKSNIIYRFRPYGNDPDRCISEIFFLSGWPKGTPRPAPAKIRWVAEGVDMADVSELGLLGPVFDQDIANLPFVQQGLKTTRKPGITLATYQESRIRHFHYLLDTWMSR
ncbi:aromatic ring-hydroxylating dioxygenase subunit alpha [Frankia sp. Cr1]|uniref:aromatic ring-hydroxylating oxygenase subunit alpha n=1 Tax=Frankia sp. Cr1 TaxID=3073931 RepID=UPI002AD519C7|nr:aromatic ring-hydroxylating dioxygenase subunit alpha [Frankia sp. Cr1]